MDDPLPHYFRRINRFIARDWGSNDIRASRIGGAAVSSTVTTAGLIVRVRTLILKAFYFFCCKRDFPDMGLLGFDITEGGPCVRRRVVFRIVAA